MRVGVGCSGVWVLVVRLGSWGGKLFKRGKFLEGRDGGGVGVVA